MSSTILFLGGAARASASAAEAAASAATAAGIATGLTYKGEDAGGDIAGLTPDDGDMYLIDTAGGGYAVDDWVVYDGSAWAVLPKSALYNVASMEEEFEQVQSQLATKASRGRAISDGATPDRATRWVPGAIGDVAGLPSALALEGVDVPAANPAGKLYLAAWAASATSDPETQAWAAALYIDTSGYLVFHVTGATPATDYRTYTSDAAVVTGEAYTTRAVLSGNSGTVSPSLSLGGATLAATEANGAGTDPDWFSPSLNTTYLLGGYELPAGQMPTVIPTLGTWTDPEALAWTAGGAFPDRFEQPGSAVNLRAGLSFQNGASAPDTLTVSGMSITQCVVTSPVDQVVTSSAFTTEVGKTYAIIIPDFALASGSYPQVRIAEATNLTTADGSDGGKDFNAYAGEAVLTFTAGGNGSNLRLGFRCDSATDFSCGPVQMVEVGSIIRPYHQPGLAVGDMNGRLAGRLVGGFQVPEAGVRDIVIDVPYAYEGSSIQVLGGDILGGLDARVVSVSGYADDDTTGSLGTTSGGTEIVNAQAIDGDFDIATFASRVISAGASLYWTPAADPTNGTLQIVLRPINQGA